LNKKLARLKRLRKFFSCTSSSVTNSESLYKNSRELASKFDSSRMFRKFLGFLAQFSGMSLERVSAGY